MSKIAMLAAAGAGYVLGTRAGRERYDAIREQAQRVWRDPRVQKKADQAQQIAKDAGSDLQEKAKDAVSSSDSTGNHAATPSPADSSTTTFPSASGTDLGRGTSGV